MPKTPYKIRRRRGRTLLDVLRAVGSLALLFALLVGLPVVLYAASLRYGPAGLDQLSSFTELFTRPDSGSAFMLALLAVGWIGWLSFALSVFLEIPAQLRGRVPRRLPGFGWSQQMAAALIGSILIIGPTAGGALAAQTTPLNSAANPVAATAPAQIHATTVADVVSADLTTQHHTYTVQQTRPAQSLWSIATEQLGDGSRWEEIAHLNEGRLMVDGSVFHAAAPIQPGWVLLMPADSAAPTAIQAGVTTHTQAGTAPAAGETVTVHPGDTLSSIAEDKLGNADEYPRLFAANQGRTEPGGEHLTDPNLILPGWELTIPAAASAAGQGDTGQQGVGGSGQQGTGPTGQGATGGSHGDQGAKPTGVATPAPSSTATPAPSSATPAPSATATSRPAPSTPVTQAPVDTPTQQAPASQAQATTAADESGDSSTAYTAAVVTSLFAAVVLSVVGTRRALQQRRRRPRRRIPLPQPATPTADLEKHLRVASDPVGLDLVDQALRTLAANCARAGRALPPLDAIRVTARGLELHLAAPTPPVAPFTELDDQPDLWWCPARGSSLLDADAARDVTAPYPALVSIGATADREPVLVNLESVGLLRLAGSDEDVRAVMLGLAVELGSSALADDATIVMAGLGEELAGAFPIRVEHHDRIEDALPELQAHDAAQRGALAAADLDGLEQARLRGDGGDAWVPKILITPTEPSEQEAGALADLLSSRPRSAACVITGSHEELDLTSAWTLPAAAGTPVVLPGLDLEVVLQRLEDDAFLPLVQLLATASRTDDVPAPEWTHAPDGGAVPNGPTQVVVGGDSALAQDAPFAEQSGKEDADGAVEEDAWEEQVVEPDTEEDQAVTAEQDASGAAAQPLVQVSVGIPSPSAVYGFSALAPTVTGMPLGEDAEGAAGAEVREEESEASTELFDTTLQEVMAERALQAGAGDSAGSDDEDSRDLDVLAQEEGSGLAAAAMAGARSETAPAPVKPAPRVTAVTSNVLAALHTPPDPPAAPQILVMGSVDVIGTLGKVESNRRNGLTEIAAWLVLHPGKSRHELDEAIWPGQRVRADLRNTNISKLRTWLGRDPLLAADDPAAAYLPLIADGVYAFGDQVTSDWSQFQDLYREGMHTTGTDADIALATALALVRGRPFSDIDQSKYSWAEYDIQEMISAIVDVAHELATRRLAMRDYRAAAAAASKGLVCDQQAELLHRDLFTIYTETGDQAGLERTAHQLTRIAIETGADSSPETVSLINALMDANRITTSA